MSEEDVKTPDAPLFSVGVIVGGKTEGNSQWSSALDLVMRESFALNHESASPEGLNLNIEFHVSGNLLQPDFIGVRPGVFRKAKRQLKVQIALPEQPPEAPTSAVINAIWDGIDCAEAWARRRQPALSTVEIRTAFDRVASSILSL